MKSYVLGFMFSNSKQCVCLIKKKRPAWQANKLNGVGGHIEPNHKNAIDAVVREFKEETGVETTQEDWSFFAHMSTDNEEVFVFRSFTDNVVNVRTMTDEEVVVSLVKDDYDFYQRIPNLNWLIPLALDKSTTFVESAF
jgi:8-oxo-dGTP diphosphatase